MFICEWCIDEKFQGASGIVAPQSYGRCESCGHTIDCFLINSDRLVPKIKYPESEKLVNAQSDSLAISAFLDFLERSGIVLCTYDVNHYDGKFPKKLNIDKNSFIFKFFGIDEKVVELEKEQMLMEQRIMDSVGRKWDAYGDVGRRKMHREAMGIEYPFKHAVSEWGDMSMNDRLRISKYYTTNK